MDDPVAYLVEPHPEVIGLGIGIRATAAYPRFAPEDGLHVFKSAKRTVRCLVHTSEQPLALYTPPPGIERRGAIGGGESLRTYDVESGLAEDTLLQRRFSWPTRNLDSVLAVVLEEKLQYNVQKTLMP